MLELDDAKYAMKDLSRRLREMGESLWHLKQNEEIKRVRR